MYRSILQNSWITSNVGGKPLTKKVIIIGAGILGAATAYELAKKGARVTVIEREAKGRATSAAAGIICPWITKRRNQAWYTLAVNGAAYYGSLIHQLGELGEQETGYKKIGAIYLGEQREKLIELEKIALKRRENAPVIGKIALLNPGETKEKFPLLDSDRFHGLYITGAARVDGSALRDALIRAAIQYGAHIVKGKAVLHTEEKRILGVMVDGQLYNADETIATNGVWMNELLTGLKVKMHFQAQKGEIVHLQISTVETDDLPVVKPPNNQYLLSFGSGKIIIGATHQSVKDFDARPTAGGMHYILDEALKAFPALKNSEVTRTHVGFRPFTYNHLPVFGRVQPYEGLLIANGLGASGLTTGPYIATLLAQMVTGEQTDIDITPYRVE